MQWPEATMCDFKCRNSGVLLLPNILRIRCAAGIVAVEPSAPALRPQQAINLDWLL